MTVIDYTNLKRRPTYDQLLNYEKSGGPKIKYPNRIATFIRRSYQLSNLLDRDGETFDAKEYEDKLLKEQQIQQTIKQISDSTDVVATELRAVKAGISTTNGKLDKISNLRQEQKVLKVKDKGIETETKLYITTRMDQIDQYHKRLIQNHKHQQQYKWTLMIIPKICKKK